ncbi:hypothetical protein FHY05_004533, partial [Sphingomonas sp. BK580]|nr:hypothetical protein [Sphingomonas sp. BK580]
MLAGSEGSALRARPERSDVSPLPAELAIVVPVYNESRNVPLLVAALDAALAD